MMEEEEVNGGEIPNYTCFFLLLSFFFSANEATIHIGFVLVVVENLAVFWLCSAAAALCPSQRSHSVGGGLVV